MHVSADSLHDCAIWKEREPDPAQTPPLQVSSSYYDNRLGYRTYRPGGAGRWLLTVTFGGEGRFRQPPQTDFRVREGDVVLLEPTAFSDYGTARSRWQFHWVHFQPLPGWESWLTLERSGRGLHRAHVASPAVRQRIDETFRRLHADLIAQDAFAEDLARSALAEILLLINRERGQDSPLDERVATALKQIHQDLAATHTVETLARSVSLSPSRFAHLFSQETGQSLIQTLTQLRLRQACRLLATTEEPISRIGGIVGFNMPHYFSRQFRAQLGMSPSAYRERCRHGFQEPKQNPVPRTRAKT